MRHIITGGSGFSGRYLTEALVERGETPVIFDVVEPSWMIGPVDFVRGDVREPQDLRGLGLGSGDVIYHLAARQFHTRVPYSGRDEWFSDVNVNGTRCLLEAMSAAGTRRLVFFSTDMTYGIPHETPVPPSHAQNPIGPYGRSKVAAERLIAQARQEFDLQATIFRPRLIAGAGRFGILHRAVPIDPQRSARADDRQRPQLLSDGGGGRLCRGRASGGGSGLPGRSFPPGLAQTADSTRAPRGLDQPGWIEFGPHSNSREFGPGVTVDVGQGRFHASLSGTVLDREHRLHPQHGRYAGGVGLDA